MQPNIKLNLGEFMWKLTNTHHPECIKEIHHIKKSTAVNSHENSQKYILPFHRTNIGKSSLAYQGIHTRNNSIPTNIKRCEIHSTFVKKLKLHPLEVEDL